MPSLFTELRRRNVFKVGAACTKMGRLRQNVNVGYVRFWPKVDVRTEPNWCSLTSAIGEVADGDSGND